MVSVSGLSLPRGEPGVVDSSWTGEAWFDEALPWWNIECEPGSGARVMVRFVETDEQGREVGGPTPWLGVGFVGDCAASVGAWVVEGPGVRIDVDYARFERAGRRRAQVRVESPWGGVRIAAVGLALSAPGESPGHGATRDDEPVSPGAVRRLGVPFVSQKTPREELAGRLCSPASVAMVLAYAGSACAVERVAGAAYDPAHDLYGNWPRNTQAAFEISGRPARVARIGSWREAEALIERGVPIVASIQVREGELPEAPYAGTEGHLIVITGFDANGDVHVNDPACADEVSGVRVYGRRGMTRVWLERTRGTAYVIEPGPGGPSWDDRHAE